MAWIPAGSLKGLQGDPGIQGQQGIQGAPGLGINFRGQVASTAKLPAEATHGDAYIVQADDSFWVWDGTSSSWVDGGSIQGPQGIAGPQGNQGIEGRAGVAGSRGTGWFTGTAAPTTVLGSMPGDLYLDQSSGDVYLLS